MKFIPQLNSLRTIAVLFVIISHYYPKTDIFTLGELGVDIFFYLSGFLITSLMLKDKIKIQEHQLLRRKAIANFYIRRALRIFPLYYIVILALYLVGEKTGTGIKENISYFILYVPNWYFYHIKTWDGILSHFWSLGVEEQYYICWPFLFFFSKGKNTLYILYVMIVLSLGIKISMSLVSKDIFYSILTINCMYKFGLGALIIYKLDSLKTFFAGRIKVLSILLIVSALIYILISFYSFPLSWFIKDIITCYFFTYCLMVSLSIKRGAIYKILSNNILISLGTVSYGIYVFHLIMPWVLFNLLNKISVLKSLNASMLFQPLCFVVTVILSYISYYYYESFFLKLKKKFS